ncbi:MAG: diacylglycerol kinase family lipid kinase [Actinobacteria bacterium]|nr:MAG: diacylglycerol kinase family lipid kinase [Actinomycetota bacterium]TML82227.1 MAG: diacylglycerol kinase family lipid kinase [Actinomycetota bacterium]
MARRLAVIVNPTAGAGKARAALPRIRAELERMQADFQVIETSSAEHARTEAAAARDRGESVGALGGDGLVGTIAGVLCRSETPLAVLPGGRGNDLARVLGIPTEPEAAARVAVEGVEKPIDVAEVDGTSYVGIASCGFDSDANRIANDAKLVRGNLVYLYAALRALAAWRHATFEVTVDGERHEISGYSVIVANSKAYGGGMFVVPHAELDDGLLDVMLSGASSKLHFLRSLPKLFNGSHVDDPNLRFIRGEEVQVSADRPFMVYADGDPIGELPVHVRVARQALRVLVPAS